MINFQRVTKIYAHRSLALNDVSFTVGKNEFISIVGRSGAGKTTLLKLLLHEEMPTRGKIFFDSQDVTKLHPGELPALRRRIGAVFQDYKLLPTKTAYENVAYIMEIMGAKDKEIARDVPEVLEIVGLSHVANNFPKELSGGEKQRVAIARALIHRPQVIVADEPTGNLDPYHVKDIMDLFRKIYELGTTIILATHHKEIVNRLGRRVITLENGKIIRDEEKGRFIL